MNSKQRRAVKKRRESYQKELAELLLVTPDVDDEPQLEEPNVDVKEMDRTNKITQRRQQKKKRTKKDSNQIPSHEKNRRGHVYRSRNAARSGAKPSSQQQKQEPRSFL